MSRLKSDNWVRKFEVSDPRHHSKGFTVYKVTSVVFPKGAPEAATKVVVWKRYNDFKKLHGKLKLYHKNCKIKDEFPKLSKAKYFKRFEDNVIKERIDCALVLLNYIGQYQPLFTCDPFLQFFENGYQLTDEKEKSVPEILDNGNCEVTAIDDSKSATTYKIINGSKKNDGMLRLGGTWDSPLISETISVNSKSSDEDSFLTTDTTGSLCSVSSPVAITGFFDSVNQNDVEADVEDPAATMPQPAATELGGCGGVREVVTCRSEKPVPPDEMWLSVRTEDFRGGCRTIGADPWPTPPGTPSDPQPQDYIVEAAYHVGQAQSYEAAGEHEAAFSFYKGAIACLLSGVQDDRDKPRRRAVRDKIAQYLQRADDIYSTYLSSDRHKVVPPSIPDLKVYKVLGVIDKVMLVLNTLEDKCYVMKVLEKSPCPIDGKKKTIIPRNVPYMVHLVKFFESENAVFLVLQYASGGRLWDHIGTYLQSVPSTPTKARLDPVFPAKPPTPPNEDKSYLDLIRQYTSDTAKKLFGYPAEPVTIPDSLLRSESHVIFDRDALCATPDPPPDIPEPPPDVDNLEVTDLVVNSQRLLESVSRTLERSETMTCSVSKELENMEELRLEPSKVQREERSTKKRSCSAVPRPRFERRFSDDLLETRSRTASSSLDRCGQWSRLAAMVEPPCARLPESTVRGWAAELLVALETLHRWGVVCRDLRPDNLLLGDHGHLLLTFHSQWCDVDALVTPQAVSSLYAAPETSKVFPTTAAADWWSYGALLYPLLTGQSLASCHPSGVYNHTILTFPEFVSPEACSLLTELLRCEPSERLGGGLNGSDDVKCHPFFESVDWYQVYGLCV